MKTIEIGIDWSRDFVDLCALMDGEKLQEKRIPVDASGFSQLQKLLEQLTKKCKNIFVAIEDDKHIVSGFLMRKGYPVYPINPKALHRYKETITQTGKKDDMVFPRYTRLRHALLNAAKYSTGFMYPKLECLRLRL